MDGVQRSFTSFEETEVVESAHLAQDSTQQVVHNLEEEARSVAEEGFKHMLLIFFGNSITVQVLNLTLFLQFFPIAQKSNRRDRRDRRASLRKQHR